MTIIDQQNLLQVTNYPKTIQVGKIKKKQKKNHFPKHPHEKKLKLKSNHLINQSHLIISSLQNTLENRINLIFHKLINQNIFIENYSFSLIFVFSLFVLSSFFPIFFLDHYFCKIVQTK